MVSAQIPVRKKSGQNPVRKKKNNFVRRGVQCLEERGAKVEMQKAEAGGKEDQLLEAWPQQEGTGEQSAVVTGPLFKARPSSLLLPLHRG